MNIDELQNTPPWEWPEDAGETILETLANRQAKTSDRLLAAELGGELVAMTDALAHGLLAVAESNDEPDELRGEAAVALGPVLEQADLDGFDDTDDLMEVPITEDTFKEIVAALHYLYFDAEVPKTVRRRILEASVRAPQDWHAEEIQNAYASGDKDWVLTAVFAMRFVPGFDDHILESLQNPDSHVHFEAVRAAGNWELKPAWDHLVKLVQDPETQRPLRLAAIDAIAAIHPREAKGILLELTESNDEEIVDAAQEAMLMAETLSEDSTQPGTPGNGKWTH